MLKRLPLLLALTVSTGCGSNSQPTKIGNKAPIPRVEVHFGAGAAEESRHLPFQIVALYEQQSLTKEPPFHVDGGEWTFFDCEGGAKSKASFTVGVMQSQSELNRPVAWGRAILIVQDREAGSQFVEAFRESFPGEIPPAVDRPYSPEPLLVHTAVLGEDLQREKLGGFSGTGGNWNATKWFPNHDLREAEIYFNYNLADRTGEFSEKDADYVDDLLAIWASALRDGPPAQRTPENDPNLTLSGPTIGQGRRLLSRLTSHFSFSSSSDYAVYQDDTTIRALPLLIDVRSPIEIARFDHFPWQMHVLNEDLDLIVQEGVPENMDVKSSADPMRIWWIDQKKKMKTLLRSPERELGLEEASVSPDFRFVGLHQWTTAPDKKSRNKRLIFLDRETGREKSVELAKKDLSLTGWKSTDDGLRAVAVTNRWRFEANEPSESYLIDPVAGSLHRQEDSSEGSTSTGLLSPDKKYRALLGKDEMVIVDVANRSERRFVFHHDDRQFVSEGAIEWVSPRYLKFRGERLALIDATTMKMSFPPTEDETKFSSHVYQFSPDFRWVMYQGENSEGEGLFLAPVVTPEET